MPIRVSVASAPVAANQIGGFSGGTVFEFLNSTKGNNGACIRIKDSKKGKNRFLNLETGKVLTSTPSDRAKLTARGTALVVA